MLLRHLPTSLIVSVLNLEIRSTMAPPARMDHALTYSGLKPTCEPDISTEFMSALVILVILMEDHLFLWYTAASGVWLLAPFCQRCDTRRLMDATANALGWPASTCPIDPPLNPLF